ncbi:MAG: hypothetical protein U5N86_04925 [Planctomycetota bacterium]|nr:hypothetical protein [Planctomycetota bacterium]
MKNSRTRILYSLVVGVLVVVCFALIFVWHYAPALSANRILTLSGVPEGLRTNERLMLFADIAAGKYGRGRKRLRSIKKDNFYYSWLEVHVCFLENKVVSDEALAKLFSASEPENASFAEPLVKFYRCAAMIRNQDLDEAREVLRDGIDRSDSILLSCLWLMVNSDKAEFDKQQMKTLTGSQNFFRYEVGFPSGKPIHLLMKCASTSYENLDGTPFGFSEDSGFRVLLPESIRVQQGVFERKKLIEIVDEYQKKGVVDWRTLEELSKQTLPDIPYISMLDKSLTSYYDSVWKGQLDAEFPYALQAILLQYFEKKVFENGDDAHIPLYSTMQKMLQANSFFLLTQDTDRARNLLKCAYRVNPGVIQPESNLEQNSPDDYAYLPLYWDLLRLLIESKCVPQ